MKLELAEPKETKFYESSSSIIDSFSLRPEPSELAKRYESLQSSYNFIMRNNDEICECKERIRENSNDLTKLKGFRKRDEIDRINKAISSMESKISTHKSKMIETLLGCGFDNYQDFHQLLVRAKREYDWYKERLEVWCRYYKSSKNNLATSKEVKF